MSLMESSIQRMGRIIQYLSGLPFQRSIVYTGPVFLFIVNQFASCVDNMSKLYFTLATDIAIDLTSESHFPLASRVGRGLGRRRGAVGVTGHCGWSLM